MGGHVSKSQRLRRRVTHFLSVFCPSALMIRNGKNDEPQAVDTGLTRDGRHVLFFFIISLFRVEVKDGAKSVRRDTETPT